MEFIFWPFITASIIFSLLGMYFKKPYLLIISAVLVVPLSLYLSAAPRFSVWGLIFPLFYVCAAIAIKNYKTRLSILFAIPMYVLIGWLGYIVLNQ